MNDLESEYEVYDKDYFLGKSSSRGAFSLLKLDEKFYDRTNTLIEYYNINQNFNGKVAEIGCGTAPFYRIASKINKFKNISILCSDITTSGVDLLEEKPEFKLARATNLPYEDSSLLGLVEWDLLEHLENPEIAIIEARRVLQVGGFIHIICPNPDSWLRYKSEEKDPYRRDKTHIFPPIVTYKFLDEILSKHGFEYEIFTRGFEGTEGKHQVGLKSMKLASSNSTGTHLVAFAKKCSNYTKGLSLTIVG